MLSAADIYKARILITDDKQANVLLLERILRGAGYTSVASTMDPRAVYELHRRNRYDLIILDLEMPGMDGFQVMEALKEIEKNSYLPVLVLTAQPEHKLRALKSGAKDFLSKPLDLSEVLTRVYNMVEVRLLYMKMVGRYSQGAEDLKTMTASRDEGTADLKSMTASRDEGTADLKRMTVSRDEGTAEIAEREKIEKALKLSNESLEQFAYVASHDLQEPLRMMASYSELLERRYKHRLDKDADEFLDYIVGGAKRLQTLINDLLTYSRVGRADKPDAEVDCEAVLGKVIRSLTPVIEESGAVITHSKLPVLTGHGANFTQLFQNLIGNALKFRGTEPPRIHISAEKRGADWLFSVKDNGIGIEPEYRDKIFLIFQRLHERGEYPGTGIGLAICKKLAEAQGGTIRVESEYGKGSVFSFTFPANKELLS